MRALRQTCDERDDCDYGYSDQNNFNWWQILFCGAEFFADIKARAYVRR